MAYEQHNYNDLLQPYNLTITEEQKQQLKTHNVEPSEDPNFGILAWIHFHQQNDFPLTIQSIITLAAEKIQASNHPYWGAQTWVNTLKQNGITPTPNTIKAAATTNLWATGPTPEKTLTGWLNQLNQTGPQGLTLIQQAKNQNITYQQLPQWAQTPAATINTQTKPTPGIGTTVQPHTGLRTITTPTLARLLKRLGDNPRIVLSGNLALPHKLLQDLDQHLPTYTTHTLNAILPIPDREGVTAETCFVGPGLRKNTNLSYIPARLSLVGTLLKTQLQPDAVILHTTPPENDTVSLGIETNILLSAIEAVRANGGLVIAAINPNMPYTYGDAQIDTSIIDYAIDYPEPLPTVNTQQIPDLYQQIGQHIADAIPNQATLQLGIGAIPDAVLSQLQTHTLRIYSEMFSDGVMNLHHNNQLDPTTPIIGSFAFGSEQFYNWIDHNHNIKMLRTETVNDPGRIAARTNMISINAALQVDLYAQANASWVGNNIHSGFGGSTDFIVGALHSPGGKAYMALPSWHEKTQTSTIVPKLQVPATSFQHSYVVTENGAAAVGGRPLHQQAQNLIEICAHNQAKNTLWEQAQTLGLIK